MNDQFDVFTVGHSNHDISDFIRLLSSHGVTAVADVRSSPFSRYVSQFNKELIRKSLGDNDIQYAFLGKELGARSEDRSCYVDGRVQYRRLASTELFREGLRRVIAGAQSSRLALMCTEKDPLDCHRTVLVARELSALGARVGHILPDGSTEPHAASMLRLRDKFGLRQTSLFLSDEELLEEALTKQEAAIAYVDAELAANSEFSTP